MPWKTVGRLRANASKSRRRFKAWKTTSLSADPAMNTEIAVLNKINAANVVALRSAQDANKLLVAMAEGQVIDAKRKRDAEAQAINNHIRFMAEGKAAMSSQAGRSPAPPCLPGACRKGGVMPTQFHE